MYITAQIVRAGTQIVVKIIGLHLLSDHTMGILKNPFSILYIQQNKKRIEFS